MKKVTVLTLGIIFLAGGLGLAQQTPPAAQTTAQTTAKPVEVGNKHCPVSGEEVGKMGAPITVEYNGKVYNLCCSGCVSSFKSDPEKYSKIAEDEAKRQAQ